VSRVIGCLWRYETAIPTERSGFGSLIKSPCDLHNQNMETPENAEPPNTRWLLFGLPAVAVGTTFLCFLLLKYPPKAGGAESWLIIWSLCAWACLQLPHPRKPPQFWTPAILAIWLALLGGFSLESFGPAWIADVIHRILCHPAAVMSLWGVVMGCLYWRWRVRSSVASRSTE
jgi:hypothetical protein